MIKALKNLFSVKEEPSSVKPGRNDLCWCGSGRKYKNCHLDADDKKVKKNYCCGPT